METSKTAKSVTPRVARLRDPTMSILRRVVCLSSRQPTACPRDVLDVCHEYPSRKSQSGIRGKLLAFGEQFALVLEGPGSAIEGLLARVHRDAADAEMSVRWTAPADEMAFRSWSIGDVYLDEVASHDVALAEELGDALIDLMSGSPAEEREFDPYERLVAILDRREFAPVYPVAATRGSLDGQPLDRGRLDAASADEKLPVADVEAL